MVAEWSVEKDTCSSDSNCTEVEIFFDMQWAIHICLRNDYNHLLESFKSLSASDPRYGGGSHNKKASTGPISVWNTTMTGTRQGKDAQSFRTRLNLSTSDNYEDYHSGHSYENSLIYYPFDRYDLQVMSIVLMWCTHLPRPALYTAATKQTFLHLLKTHQQMNQLTWNFLRALDSSCTLPTLHIWFKHLIKSFQATSDLQLCLQGAQDRRKQTGSLIWICASNVTLWLSSIV